MFNSDIRTENIRWLLYYSLLGMTITLIIFIFWGHHIGFLQLNSWAAQYPAKIWQILTMLGDERCAAGFALFFTLRYPKIFWALALAAGFGALASRGLKELFNALRPPAVLAVNNFHLIGPALYHQSFPSGHSTTAGVIGGVCAAYIYPTFLRILILLFIILIGLSRIAVGAHWPLDISAGLSLGIFSAWLGIHYSIRWSHLANLIWLRLVLIFLASGLALSLLF